MSLVLTDILGVHTYCTGLRFYRPFVPVEVSTWLFACVTNSSSHRMGMSSNSSLVQESVSCTVFHNQLNAYNSMRCWCQPCVCSNLCCVQIWYSTLQYAEGVVVKVMICSPVIQLLTMFPLSLLYNLAQEDDLKFWDVLIKFVKKLFLIPVPPPGRICIVSY